MPWAATVGRAGLAAVLAFGVHNLFDVTLLETTATLFLGLLGLLTAAVTAAMADDPAPHQG